MAGARSCTASTSSSPSRRPDPVAALEAVRPAGIADAGDVLRLVQECTDSVRHQRGGPLVLAERHALLAELGSAGGLDRLRADPDRLVLVGTLDGVVTGGAVGHVVRLGGGHLGCLDGYYVEPGARGLGLGTLLVEAAVAWFRDRGCIGVDGTALPGNRAAKSLFEASGFKARELTMHLPLT